MSAMERTLRRRAPRDGWPARGVVELQQLLRHHPERRHRAQCALPHRACVARRDARGRWPRLVGTPCRRGRVASWRARRGRARSQRLAPAGLRSRLSLRAPLAPGRPPSPPPTPFRPTPTPPAPGPAGPPCPSAGRSEDRQIRPRGTSSAPAFPQGRRARKTPGKPREGEGERERERGPRRSARHLRFILELRLRVGFRFGLFAVSQGIRVRAFGARARARACALMGRRRGACMLSFCTQMFFTCTFDSSLSTDARADDEYEPVVRRDRHQNALYFVIAAEMGDANAVWWGACASGLGLYCLRLAHGVGCSGQWLAHAR